MELTSFTDYSLRVLIYLGQSREPLIAIDELADHYQVSRHHIAKVVQRLAELGYVETVRGKGGGIRLRQDPLDINIGAVVRATEPHFHLVECFDRARNQCILTKHCGLKAVLSEAQRSFFDVLNQKSLADVLPGRSAAP